MMAPCRPTRQVITRSLFLLFLLAGGNTAFGELTQAKSQAASGPATLGMGRADGISSGLHPRERAAWSVGIDPAVITRQPSRISFTLPTGESFESILHHVEHKAGGGIVWRGTRAGEEYISSRITVKNGMVSGYLEGLVNRYELHAVRPGESRIALVDPTFVEPVDDPLIPSKDPRPSGSTSRQELAEDDLPDEPDEIDLMVIYTPQAREIWGGTAGIEAEIESMVDHTNTTFINSNLQARLNLVYMALTDYNDTGESTTDLVWLRFDEGVIDLRMQHRADMVALIVGAFDACGRGYLGSDRLGSWPWAVQATASRCGGFTFAHETGHNFGMHHEPANAGSGGAFPYSYGHWEDGVFSTTMAYGSECTMACQRIANFSDPDHLYEDLPVGTVDRDNQRTGENTQRLIANYYLRHSPIIELATSNSELYAPGDSVEINVEIDAPANINIIVVAEVRLAGTETWLGTPDDALSLELNAGRTEIDRGFPLHTNAEPGEYDIRVNMYRDMGNIGAFYAWEDQRIDSVVIPAAFQVTGPPPQVCNATPIACQSTRSGALAINDCSTGPRGETYRSEVHTFEGQAGQAVDITLWGQSLPGANPLDGVLYLESPSGLIETFNDDNGAFGAESSIRWVLLESGTYTIWATGFDPSDSGRSDALGRYELYLRCYQADCIYNLENPFGSVRVPQGSIYPIRWSTSGSQCGATARLDLRDSGSLIEVLAEPSPESGQLNWEVPDDLPEGSRYWLTLGEPTSPYVVGAQSRFYFAVTERSSCSYELDLPTAGTHWTIGREQVVRWRSYGEGCDEDVRIDLYSPDAGTRLISEITPNDGVFTWNVPNDVKPGSNYNVRLLKDNGSLIWAWSGKRFSLECDSDPNQIAAFARSLNRSILGNDVPGGCGEDAEAQSVPRAPSQQGLRDTELR